jgi:inosine-uridine nucleoside N-ribohydrolase
MTRKVLYDVDPGCDDSTMIMMSLGSDELEVVGVTTVYGNASIEYTTRNALAVLEFAERLDVPVARGCGRPFVGDAEIPFEPDDVDAVHGTNGLTWDVSETAGEPVEQHAADFIVEQARVHGDELTIASVGPQTNLALALAKEPDLPHLVDDIYFMGGSAKAPGNTTPLAELNIYKDPHSASRVMQEAHPHMVGVYATNQTYAPFDLIDEFDERGGAYRRIAEILDYYPRETLDRFGQANGPVVHDSLVAADLIGDIVDFESYYVEVGTNEGHCRGATIIDERGVIWEDEQPNAELAVNVDTDRYVSILRETLGSLAERVGTSATRD